MCKICKRIKQMKFNENPYFVRELSSGYIVIGDHQYFKGYTLFLYRDHIDRLEDLPDQKKLAFLNEMSLVGQAVKIAFSATQINYELLGNGDSHLHWHLFARRKSDLPTNSKDAWYYGTSGSGPVWWLNPKIMFEKENEPSNSELENMKLQLNRALDQIL